MAKSETHRDPETLVWKSETDTWKLLTKSEPKTLYEENRTRDFILQKSELFSKTVFSRDMNYMIF